MPLPSLSVRRELSAERVNTISNHPEVRPWLGGVGEIDLADIVANRANVLLMGEGGGFIFVQQEPGIYEVHTQFLPDHRGEEVITAARDAERWMFCRTDCIEIRSKVPAGNVGAAAFARAMKYELQFVRANAWQTPEGLTSVKYYARSITQWANQAHEMKEVGDQFHHKLAEAKERLGASNPPHDDDDAHDLYVGATVEMIASGNIAKGIGFYNRWAAFAGYGAVSVLSLSPLLIDIQDAILVVREGNFEVLLCR